jgi:hypothetical protein
VASASCTPRAQPNEGNVYTELTGESTAWLLS